MEMQNHDETTMFCSDCGADISENDRICPKCGEAVNEIMEKESQDITKTVSETKKQSKDWRIAATHYLIGGFAVPTLVSLILNAGESAGIVIAKDIPLAVAMFIGWSLWVLIIWLGVMSSAKYLARTYIIKNSGNIVKLSTIYLVVINGVCILLVKMAHGIRGIGDIVIIALGIFIVRVAVFYILSKRYVKNTDQLPVMTK